MSNLRSGQIAAMLITSAAFSMLCQTSAFTVEGILGAGIAAIVQILFCLPVLAAYANGSSFSAYAKSHRFLPLCFVLYFLLRGGISMQQLQDTSTELSIPVTGKYTAAAMIAIVCFYTVSLGIQALARSSTLIFGILIASLAILFLGAFSQAEWQHLSLSPDDTIWKGFLRSMQTADELPALFLLLSLTDKKRIRSTLQVWIGKFLVFIWLALLSITVLGNRMGTASHPFFELIAVSQPFSTQRADAIYLIVYSLLCVLRVTLFTVLAAHLLRICIPGLRGSSAICLLLILAVGWAAAKVHLSGIWNLAAILFFTLLVPIALRRNRKQGGIPA